MNENEKIGVFDEPIEDYHLSPGVSRSKLWTFKESPARYQFEYLSDAKPEKKSSPAMLLGSAVHTLTLEPQIFDETFAVAPEVDKRTKLGKEVWEAFCLTAENKSVLSTEVYDKALNIKNSLLLNEVFCDLLDGAKIEKSIYFRHEPTGIICKSRPDIWTSKILVDLKTTRSATYRSFQRDAYDSGYFLQAGMAFEALKSIGERPEGFVFACVETEEPYLTGIYLLDDQAIQFGIDMFNALMKKFATCIEKHEWPSYGVQHLCIPAYATYEMDYD